MENIFDIAKYFLNKDSMSHKKLQKLCYFAQAWYLANHGVPLAPNRFEAWAHGPVSPDLYSKYKGWGWERIRQNNTDVIFEDPYAGVFLDEVYDVYGEYDGDQLEKITHEEEPWIKARNGCAAGAYSRSPISQKDMRDYYGERIDRKYD